MRAVSGLLIFGICAVSASIPHSTFRYELQTSYRRSEDSCRLCYGDDCITMPEARCQYYADADEVLDKDENDGEVTEVDGMVYDLTEQAALSWTVQQCVPLISRYTDCTKDNVCLGCRVCTCTSVGQWHCRSASRCRPEPGGNVDHRTLVMVMEKLLEREKELRRKRAINNATDKVQVKKMGYVDIADWMYGVKPSSVDDFPFSDVETDNFVKALLNQEPFQTQTQTSKRLSKQTDPDEIDFEEVLKNIAIDDQNYKERKSKLKDNNNTDNMGLEDSKVISSNASDEFIHVLNDIEEGKDVTESVDTIVNLLPRNNYYNDDVNATDNNIIGKEDRNAIDANYLSRFDAVHVMKRDVFSVTNLKNTTHAANASNATFETTTSKENYIENNVMKPLTSIINDKVDEIKQLIQIRDNLMNFMNIQNDSNVNIVSRPEIINSSKTFFSIYTLDLYPEIHENLRNINKNVLEKLLYKLKRDIYEVLRDISRIQKVSKTDGLPADLKILVRSMKYYVHEQGNFRNLKNKGIELEKNKNRRRLWSSPTDMVMDTSNSIKSQLFNIFEALVKDKPLEMVSKSAKKIITHVIKENYIDDFSNVGLRVSDPTYNLTNDLKIIGKDWPQLTAYVASSPLHDKLYAMKLLHFNLAEDINRLVDAIALVNFAHSRRMTPLETPMATEIMDKVNDGLLLIKNKINLLLQYQADNTRTYAKVAKKHKKESFFKKLRNLLKNSKSEVIEMVNKKVPKSEIVRRIAEKKLDELTLKKMSEYEQTMLKWQRNLKMARRKKRHLEPKLNNLKHNIKNIIPKYLQGKINPALVARRNYNKHSGFNKKNETMNPEKLATRLVLSINTTTLNDHEYDYNKKYYN